MLYGGGTGIGQGATRIRHIRIWPCSTVKRLWLSISGLPPCRPHNGIKARSPSTGRPSVRHTDLTTKDEAHMKIQQFDSHCIECKRPCKAPRGNFNAQRVSLCKRKKCRRDRKTALQREARKQLDLVLSETRKRRTEKRKAVKSSSLTKGQRKARFYGQSTEIT